MRATGHRFLFEEDVESCLDGLGNLEQLKLVTNSIFFIEN